VEGETGTGTILGGPLTEIPPSYHSIQISGNAIKIARGPSSTKKKKKKKKVMGGPHSTLTLTLALTTRALKL
jgi:hypothetical protein